MQGKLLPFKDKSPVARGEKAELVREMQCKENYDHEFNTKFKDLSPVARVEKAESRRQEGPRQEED